MILSDRFFDGANNVHRSALIRNDRATLSGLVCSSLAWIGSHPLPLLCILLGLRLALSLRLCLRLSLSLSLLFSSNLPQRLMRFYRNFVWVFVFIFYVFIYLFLRFLSQFFLLPFSVCLVDFLWLV